MVERVLGDLLWKSAAPETIVEILYVINLVFHYHSAHVPPYEIYLST
jgi:hypothetical protein